MTTVADIVIARPAAARVFERHAIDYCCHGQRPLDQACAEAGADIDAVQAARCLVDLGIEFAACMERGEHHFRGRTAV